MGGQSPGPQALVEGRPWWCHHRQATAVSLVATMPPMVHLLLLGCTMVQGLGGGEEWGEGWQEGREGREGRAVEGGALPPGVAAYNRVDTPFAGQITLGIYTLA